MYRITGYYTPEAKEIIDKFKKSDDLSLEQFLLKKVKNIFKDCLFLEHQGSLSKESFNSIDMICNDQDIRKLFERFHKQFVFKKDKVI